LQRKLFQQLEQRELIDERSNKTYSAKTQMPGCLEIANAHVISVASYRLQHLSAHIRDKLVDDTLIGKSACVSKIIHINIASLCSNLAKDPAHNLA